MEYDLAIIGAGWAGFNAAQKARQAGLKVCLIEKDLIGGTCLNRGCIPTKTLIQSAKVYCLAKKAKNFGIENIEPRINFAQIQSRKDKVVEQLRRGMEAMLKGIDVLRAEAEFLSANTLKAGSQEISAKFILLASGSRPQELNGLKFDHKKIISSDQILNLKELPQSLLVIGGGVIGCEFASLFANFGVGVTVAEKMPQLLPGQDGEAARRLENIFKKRGLKVNTNSDALSLDLSAYDLVLLCVGRQPYIEGLGIDKAGIKLEKGKICLDEYLRTNLKHIFAAGDCTAGLMLAHFAAYQGTIAAENIIHQDALKESDSRSVPNCIFTDPQVASVGLTQEEAQKQGREIRINRFDFLGSGMARIIDEAEGFLKIISDKKSSQILGGSIIGPAATELIAIVAVAVTNHLTVTQMKNTIFAHPTLSECLADALKEDGI